MQKLRSLLFLIFIGLVFSGILSGTRVLFIYNTNLSISIFLPIQNGKDIFSSWLNFNLSWFSSYPNGLKAFK